MDEEIKQALYGTAGYGGSYLLKVAADGIFGKDITAIQLLQISILIPKGR